LMSALKDSGIWRVLWWIDDTDTEIDDGGGKRIYSSRGSLIDRARRTAPLPSFWLI
jgi:hypothetical protein